MPTDPERSSPRPEPSFLRRLVGAMIVSAGVFAVLAYVLSSMFIAGMVAAGTGGALIVGSSVSDVLEVILEAVGSALSAALAAVAAILGAVFGAFG